MKLRATFAALVLAGLCAAGAGYAADAKPQPAPSPQEKAWADWMQKNVPGDNHKLLAQLAGEWNIQVKTWMSPDAPSMSSTGTSSVKMILDGRYLQENATGNMGGLPFNGQGLTAYDNASKKYQATWVDNMATAIYHCDGAYDAGSKSITMNGMTYDPVVGKEVAVKTVTRFVDDKSHVFEWWSPDAKGKMFKSMEITYTRQ
jgi:hypothetical protein